MTNKAKEFRANLEILAEKLAADYKQTGSTISWTDHETISDFLYRINEDLGGNPLYFDRATSIRDDWSSTIMVSIRQRSVHAWKDCRNRLGRAIRRL